jgi:hypothetical protein
MRRKGVVYDAGCVTGMTWRPDYSPALARRELEIVEAGLHCNAVEISAPASRSSARSSPPAPTTGR